MTPIQHLNCYFISEKRKANASKNKEEVSKEAIDKLRGHLKIEYEFYHFALQKFLDKCASLGITVENNIP